MIFLSLLLWIWVQKSLSSSHLWFHKSVSTWRLILALLLLIMFINRLFLISKGSLSSTEQKFMSIEEINEKRQITAEVKWWSYEILSWLDLIVDDKMKMNLNDFQKMNLKYFFVNESKKGIFHYISRQK
jgi:hypothetical protein